MGQIKADNYCIGGYLKLDAAQPKKLNIFNDDKNTVLYILGSMFVTFMIGLGVCQLGYSPWIWAAFAFVLSLRYTWDQVT